jgi:branched-chain amino acid transport system ATP-binding protein
MATKPAEPATDEPLLSVRDVTVRFGGIVALDGIAFDMPRGVVLGLIGPNGAGKTTLFNCLSRIYEPSSGDVRFEGETILDRPAHRMAEIGIGRTFQNLALFQNLSVRDNIKIGGHTRSRGGYITDALRLPASRASERDLSARVSELIDYLELGDVADRPVAGLPFGTQKRVELARALAAQPKLLLLDEPACGLNHEEVHELGNLIRQIRDERRITVLLVEHHMSLVMSISDRVVALNFGRKLAEGTPREIQANEDVVRAYLGDAA